MSILRSFANLFRRSMAPNVARKEPIIFVVGCTGTGKSDIGVAISKKYNGEVISSDSMQLYKGLDIATNKITIEEAEGIPHHMMSFLDPGTSKYHIHQFRKDCLAIIEDIRSRGRMPVVVGGTSYYVESLLFRGNLIDAAVSDEAEADSTSFGDDLKNMSVDELYSLLKQIDPDSAALVHPNNRSRVQRAIEVFRQTGKTKSEHLREQDNEAGDIGGRLRFDEALVLYLDASAEVLDERLDGRVEKMCRMGLKQELHDFYEEHHEKFDSLQKFGVLQCIGLKEFLPYLRLDEAEREAEKGRKLFQSCCEDVKLHTRQYARRQRNWVNSRFLKRRGEMMLPSFNRLDTSDKYSFISTGMDLVDRWMGGEDLSEVKQNDTNIRKSSEANALLHCDVCNMLISGQGCWKAHLVGKKHKAKLKAAQSKASE